MFDVTVAQIAVRIALSLNSFDCTISTGRRNPGPDPCGSPSDAHQISPRRTTISLAAGIAFVPSRKVGRGRNRRRGPRTPRQAVRALRKTSRSSRTQSRRLHRVRFETSLAAWRAARLPRKWRPVWRLPSSHPKYNCSYTRHTSAGIRRVHMSNSHASGSEWSGRRVSNPRPSVWETDALPTELHPRSINSIRPTVGSATQRASLRIKTRSRRSDCPV